VEKDEGGVLAICPLAAWPLQPTFRAPHGPSSALQRARMVTGGWDRGQRAVVCKGRARGRRRGRGCGIRRHAAPSDKWARDPEPLHLSLSKDSIPRPTPVYACQRLREGSRPNGLQRGGGPRGKGREGRKEPGELPDLGGAP
jgi:hypothetical protein